MFSTVSKVAVGLSVLTLTLITTGCRETRNPSLGSAWYNVYGQHCNNGAPAPGCNYYSNGDKIIDVEDPYHSGYYNLSYGTWRYTDSYGYSQWYTGWGWVSPNGILYDSYGYSLNKSGRSRGLDVEAHAAEQETQVISQAGESLVEKFSLEADVGVRIAATLNDWATLGKYRARTRGDDKDFIQRLYGVDVDQAAVALASARVGDKSGVLAINKQIAAAWKTNEEVSELILKTWYERQLKEFGIED